MEFLELEWVQWVLGLAGTLITLWVIPNAWWAKIISFFGAKLAPAMDKVAAGMDTAGTLIGGKVGEALHKGSDVVDEAEDIPRLLAEWTAEGKLTAEHIKRLIKETGEVGVAFKDMILVVKKKD